MKHDGLAAGAAGPASDAWLALLMRQAPLEFLRVAYGLEDCAHGRHRTSVAAAVRQAEQAGASFTRERAQQRARAYLPVAGHAHCPRCWVFLGAKHQLQLAPVAVHAGAEIARCPHCAAEYVLVPEPGT